MSVEVEFSPILCQVSVAVLLHGVTKAMMFVLWRFVRLGNTVTIYAKFVSTEA